jgi:excisionase family DNA binding protein
MPVQIQDTTLYSVLELAQMLDVTTATIRNYIRQGHIRGQKVMGRWCVSNEDLKGFVREFGLEF